MSAIDNCVVVSCAGGGKTTKLIERLLSLLLEQGTAPGEILIITFTNKAAAEIRARLLAKLEEKARADSAAAALRRRILLSAAPGDALSVHTFHSWFLTLLRHRPGGFFSPPNVCADDAEVFEDGWRRWRRRAEKSPSPALKTVLRELTPAAARKMCGQFIRHRAACETYCETRGWRPPSSSEIFDAASEAEMLRALQDCAAAFAADKTGGGAIVSDARCAAARLASGESSPEKEKRYFFTNTDSVRVALEKHAAKNAPLLAELTAALANFFVYEEERRAHEFNAAALEVCGEFAREWDAALQARNEITFDDMERRVRAMLREENIYAELSYRLAARYRHILIDEFQDTSPMQWGIVRKWLRDAHGEDAPSVFIVGDPKQAIYGFRHGDSRLLGEAENFLREYYGAKKSSPQNICYRCGENILKFVNAVFDEERLPGFLPHRAGGGGGGRVEWHALQPAPKPPRRARVRNPLQETEAAADMPHLRAAAVAAKVAEILREWQIPDEPGANKTRRCVAADILILTPQLTHAAALADALAAKNISCALAGGESFLESFECADILDLIAALLSPERDYALARVLKSPLFALSDEELSVVAAADGDSLWEKLQRHPAAYARRARVLLKLWRRRAETTPLPAHDFLSRLFAQGEVFARYRAASPPPLHLRIGENLTRLLDLSLQIAGGARPLLAQFLDEVRRADGAPRKFDSSPPAAVRLMSIHAAKGLESPVVILTETDFARTGGRGDGTDIFVDWPPSSSAAENFVVSLRRHRRANAALKQKAKKAEEQEQTNLFYVAATRAKRALVIFSSDKPEGIAARAARAMRDLSSAQNAKDSGAQKVFGDSFFAPAAEAKTKPPPPAAAPAANIGRRLPKTAAAVRGEIRHRIIALLLSGISPAAARSLVAAEDAQWREAEKIAAAPPLQKLLQNAAEVLIERDFFIGGEIVRPDLIVARDDAVWIVDYKTGAAVSRPPPPAAGKLSPRRRRPLSRPPDSPRHSGHPRKNALFGFRMSGIFRAGW